MAAPSAQPISLADEWRGAPRWLWAITLLVVIGLTAIRLVVFSSLDLRTDEAYYWTWSQQPALSFLDQPPMVAWFVRLGVALFGESPFAARFAQILALPLMEIVFADIARRRTGSMHAALLVVLGLEASVNFGVTAAIIEPGMPMLLFAGLLFWTLGRLEETRDPRWWLAAGAFGGLAMLSKFTVVFFVPAVASYALGSARNRRWLLGPWPWLALLIALLAFSPVVIWNVWHDWASLAFQGGRATISGGVDLGGLGTYFATNLAFAGLLLAPVVIVAAFVAAPGFWRAGEPFDLALAVAFLAPFLYLAERSLHLSVNPSWPIVMWPFGIVTLAILVASRPARWWRGATYAGIATGLPVVLALLLHSVVGNDVWLGNHDPIGGDAGYGPLAAQVLATARATGATWIATSDYGTYAELRWHLGRDLPVIEVVERGRFLDFAPEDMTQIAGHAGLYVFAGAGNALVEQAIDGKSQSAGTADRVWRGYTMERFSVILIHGWTPDLTPQPGTPFYRWVSLT